MAAGADHPLRRARRRLCPRSGAAAADPGRAAAGEPALRAADQRPRLRQADRPLRCRRRARVRPAALRAPVFDAGAMALIAPVAIVLVAENLGHLKAVAAMTGRNLDPYMGRAFLGDGLATIVAGAVGGPGVTTYAENIGVMAVTKIYSTLLFVVAALFAVLLGFSPKFGALIGTIPAPVLGGVSIVVFGLIAVAGARIWVQNRVDFGDNRNLVVAAVTLVLGAGDFTLPGGGFALGGAGPAAVGAGPLYAPPRARRRGAAAGDAAP